MASPRGGRCGRIVRLAKQGDDRWPRTRSPGDDRRVGAVKTRSQVKTPLTGNWTKRDAKSGKFMDQKEDGKPFKGVRKEK
jgi:hypothetical protein